MAAGPLVTGGTEGIGEAIVARLRESEVKVLTTARKTPAELHEADLFVAAGHCHCRRLRESMKLLPLRPARTRVAFLGFPDRKAAGHWAIIEWNSPSMTNSSKR